jgi:hypothetical protein
MTIPRLQVFRSVLAAILFSALCSCDNGGTLLVPPGGTAWVATDPIQCLGNPWERDWLAHNGNNYAAYPRDIDSQKVILRQYYAGLGIPIMEIVSIMTHPVTCMACTCPRGDTLYLLVPAGDADAMIGLGYRREAPGPLPPTTD